MALIRSVRKDPVVFCPQSVRELCQSGDWRPEQCEAHDPRNMASVGTDDSQRRQGEDGRKPPIGESHRTRSSRSKVARSRRKPGCGLLRRSPSATLRSSPMLSTPPVSLRPGARLTASPGLFLSNISQKRHFTNEGKAGAPTREMQTLAHLNHPCYNPLASNYAFSAN